MKNKRSGKYETKISKLILFNLKSQVAIEFLMTYGWAILLVLVVMGALAYFGVLDPLLYFTGSKCKIYGGFYCEDFKIDGSNQQVSLVVRNGMGFNANDVTASMNSETCTEAGAKGAVQVSGDVVVSGSNTVIKGGLLYGTTFTNSGSDNIFDPAPQQYTGEVPEPFDIEDYKPGGSAASQAQAEGKYTYIVGDLDTSSLFPLDGLYYVTQEAKLSRSDVSGTYTIVAEGKIDIGGSDQTGISYLDDLSFFSNAVGTDAIKLGSSTNTFTGYFYAPNGQIIESGSANLISGGFLASQVSLSGSGLTTIYVPITTDVRADIDKIPNPWNNSQRVLLAFNCSGSLQRSFEGKLKINWNTEQGGRHTAIGVVQGKTE